VVEGAGAELSEEEAEADADGPVTPEEAAELGGELGTYQMVDKFGRRW
jgi:hypothetical protein